MKRLLIIPLLILPVFVFAQTSTSTPDPLADHRSPEAQKIILDAFGNFFRRENATKPNVTVSLSSSPAAVSPGATVVMYARGTGESIGNALVVWYLNGKEVQRGRGVISYTLKAGEVGSQDVVEVTVTFAGGAVKTARATIIPASVRFLWEADSTTPAWYKGGRLASPGSHITVRAFPTITVGGATLQRSQLRYDWEINRAPLRDQSGVGRDVIRFDAGKTSGTTQMVTVRVSAQGGGIQGRGNVAIPVQSQEIYIYRQLPLVGIVLEDAISRVNVSRSRSLTVRAVPFFAPPQKNVFSWTTNNESLPTAQDPYTLTIQTPDAQVSQSFTASLTTHSFFSRANASLVVETN